MYSRRRGAKIRAEMDKSAFFGWVGASALLLALPLSILANLWTPKIASLWARTSSKRREKRIKIFKEKLATITLLLGDSLLRFDCLAKGLRYLAFSLFGMFYYLMGIIGSTLAIHAHLAGFTSHLSGGEFSLETYRFAEITSFSLYSLTFYFVVRAATAFELASRFSLESKKRRIERELKKLCG